MRKVGWSEGDHKEMSRNHAGANPPMDVAVDSAAINKCWFVASVPFPTCVWLLHCSFGGRTLSPRRRIMVKITRRGLTYHVGYVFCSNF